MSEQLSTERPAPRRRGRTIGGILIVALAGALVGGLVSTSLGQGFGPRWHMTVMGSMAGPLTPAIVADRANRMVRHVAIEIDASADQQTKLEAIVKAAVSDLVPMREKIITARWQARELLTQTTVDRSAIERLRTEQIATMDTISKRVATAIGDAAEVLTPDQRRKLGEMLPPDGPGGGYWHH